MTGVRGHEPTCPIARETWCLWTGDKCDYCVAYRRGYADALAQVTEEVAMEGIRAEKYQRTDDALDVIDRLRQKLGAS